MRDQAAMHITQVMGGVHLNVRKCARAGRPHFHISETAGRITLKFGVWLETHQIWRFTKVYGVHLHVRMCACADVPLSYLGIGWTD